MERLVRLHIEKLPEGVYLATSEDVEGLVAQGRTVHETIEIARDVARKIMEERGLTDLDREMDEPFDIPVVV
jgi:predicted RNase H-like HicB family nuclease